MYSKIEKSFQNSQFYRNYNNIDIVTSIFEKIESEYKSSKNKYKNEMISIIDILNKNQIQSNFYDKFNKKINIEEHIFNSYRNILNKKLSISHNIKKYVKYSENINDDFIKSVEIRNIRNIDTLIKNGANIHANDDYAIKFSSKNGNIEIVKFLIENGADIHIDNDYAIRLSSENGHIDVVKFLIENGTNVQAVDDYALKWSSENGHIDVVKFLTENGANIHADDDFALELSSSNGHIEVVKFLVENGANIHADDDYALQLSSYNGHIEVVKFLVENGANIHANNDYALQLSSYNGHIEVVKFLIEKGANIHANDDYALKISSKHEHIEVVKFLIQSDIEYFRDNKDIKCYVKSHILDEIFRVDTPKKKEIIYHIKNQNIELIKKCDNFDFSSEGYHCFFKALKTDNTELIQIIFDKLQNKDDLLNFYNKILPILDYNIKNKVNQLYENNKLEKKIK